MNARTYHAGMKDSERTDVLRLWTANQVHVIIATVRSCSVSVAD